MKMEFEVKAEEEVRLEVEGTTTSETASLAGLQATRPTRDWANAPPGKGGMMAKDMIPKARYAPAFVDGNYRILSADSLPSPSAHRLTDPPIDPPTDPPTHPLFALLRLELAGRRRSSTRVTPAPASTE